MEHVLGHKSQFKSHFSDLPFGWLWANNLWISLFISKLGVPMRIKWNNPEKVSGPIPDIQWTPDKWNLWRHPSPLAMRFRSNWVSVAQEKWQVGRKGRLGLTRSRLTAPEGADRAHCWLWQHELIKSIHRGLPGPPGTWKAYQGRCAPASLRNARKGWR